MNLSQTMSSNQTKIVTLFICLVFPLVAHGQVFDFTPLGQQNSFETSTNWSPLGPPGVSDTARFNFNTSYDVLFSSSPINRTLQFDGGNVTFRPLFSNAGTDTYTVTENANIAGGQLSLSGHGARQFSLVVEDQLNVGAVGGTTLMLQNGSRVFSQLGNIGNAAGTSGQVIVRGADAKWVNTDVVIVGDRGDGELIVDAGGTVSFNRLLAGRNEGTGTVSVRGTETVFDVTGVIDLGSGREQGGIGRLFVEDGATVSSVVGVVGASTVPGSVGIATIQGNGSTWTTSGFLLIGNNSGIAYGQLNITNGGRVFVGTFSDVGDADVTVADPGSSWNISDTLTIGNVDGSQMFIQNGGVVSSSVGAIGLFAGESGFIQVSGANSNWNSANNLRVGVDGSGVLMIESGGTVSNQNGIVGDGSTGSGIIVVDGIGSSWTNSSGLFVGGNQVSNGGSGTVTIQNGGTVTAADATRIHTDGQLNLLGGTLSTATLKDSGGTFNWVQGTVNLTDPAGLILGKGAFEFAESALTLNSNQSLGIDGKLTITDASSLTMMGGMLTTGSAEVHAGGVLSLTGNNHDFGAGLLNEGSVMFDDVAISGSVTSIAGSDITILNDVRYENMVSGSAEFLGTGTATFNGGYDPGDSPAIIGVEGDIVFGVDNTLFVELAGLLDGEFDRLEINGGASLGGMLSLNLIDGFNPSSGSIFEILDIGGELNGQFTGLEEGALFSSGGQRFRISYFGGDGNDVTLTAIPEPNGLCIIVLATFGLVIRRQERQSP